MKTYCKQIKLILLLLLVIILTACSAVVKTPMDLIKKPMVPSGGEFPKDVIMTSLPDSAALIRPISQDLSSIDYIGLTPNQRPNIYAFYKNEDNASVGAIILEQSGNVWRPISMVEEKASDIVLAEFVDFNGDGAKDLIMGMSISDEYFNSINFYQNSGGDFNRVYQDTYTDFIHQDLDGDGMRDILLLKINRNNTTIAKLLAAEGNEIMLKDELIMDEYNSGYYHSIYGRVNEFQEGVVLDKKVGINYASNIVLYDGDSLSLALDDQMTAQLDKTFKHHPMKSVDVNNDGIIEIAISIIPKFYVENRLSNTVPYLYGWHQIDPSGQLKLVKLTYEDEDNNFRLNLPSRWLNAYARGELTLITSPKDSAKAFVTFYYTPNDHKVIRLYTIERISENNYDQEKLRIEKFGGRYFMHDYADGMYYFGRYYPDLKALNMEDRLALKSLLPTVKEQREFFKKYN